MTYSAGQTIAAADYNGFVTSINSVLTSYGQTTLSTVTGGTSVVTSSGQWAALGANINLLSTHQGTSTVSNYSGQFGAGTTVTALSTVSGDLANISAGGNVLSAGSQGSQYTGWTGTAYKAGTTGTGTAAWTIVFTDTISWNNATQASAFFNAGGVIKIQFGKSSTGLANDTEWNTFVGLDGAGGNATSGVASAVFLTSSSTSKTLPQGSGILGTYKTGGATSPTTLATGIGYAQLTASDQTIYKQSDGSATYTDNFVQVQARQNGSGVLTLTTTWSDGGSAYTNQISGGTSPSGVTFGSAPTTIVTYFPPPNNLTNNSAWGAPTVVSGVV